ncbi:MAG: peptide deformylase [Rhodobacteraceae bacterium]|jgi:peptide deformylase|uniref:peptide deformylase n=1 Tax=uncultured Planktomarina sp. TaxID=1538529 RepID=UPI002A092E22|nr:peptide deformylase [Paracoccaceae bacterium]MBT7342890.1 peptide deformylase [Paracoccaceae bacterium]
MSRSVVPWTHPCLRRAASPIEKITPEIEDIWRDMIAVMEAMPGVGLAAPQLGIGLRLAVVDASSARGEVLRMANPEILHVSAKVEMGEEASPNLPYVSAQIERPRGVTVRYMDEAGAWQEKDLVGLWARSTLHQVDHLNGRMYFDHLSKLKRDMLIKKARKLCA